MSHNHDIDAIADTLIQAISSFDPELQRQALSPEFTVWHNTDDQTLDINGSIAYFQNLAGIFKDVQFTDVHRVRTDDGYVQESTIIATTNDDRVTKAHACIVVKLTEDGRILNVHEYIDSAAYAGVLTH